MVQFNIHKFHEETQEEEDEPPSLESYISSKFDDGEKLIQGGSISQESAEDIFTENYECCPFPGETYLNDSKQPPQQEERVAELNADAITYLFSTPDTGSFYCPITYDDEETSPAIPLKLYLALIAKNTALREIREMCSTHHNYCS